MAPIKVRNLEQSVILPAPPSEVYKALVDPKEHAKFSGAFARLEAKPGGRFEHYDGSLVGRVVELRPDRRIVLAWRSDGWPEGQYSIARFQLTRSGRGTKLEFSQYGIPASDYADIREGWKTYYWEPLKAYLDPTGR